MSRRQILVADDNLVNRRLVQTALTRSGYDVRETKDGKATLASCLQEKPDLAIVDIHMPEMDGLELLVHFRTSAPGMPVIVMSGGVQTGSLNLLADARLLGAFATLAKPFSVDELLGAVARALAPGPRAGTG